jgi:hypothetical protein
MRIDISPKVNRKLAEYAQYWDDRNEVGMYDFLEERLIVISAQLKVFPESGHRLVGTDLCEILLSKTQMLIWYTVSSKVISISDIWHSSQVRIPKVN